MFNERLKTIRKTSKITQQSMANKLEISLNAYQKYEQGERSPSLETLVQIADIFDVSLDYLLCRDDFIRSHEELSDQS